MPQERKIKIDMFEGHDFFFPDNADKRLPLPQKVTPTVD